MNGTGDNKVNLTIDSRETQLYKELSSLNADFFTKQLPVGDILLEDAISGELLCICERKTKNDLYSSIVDKRFADQRARLLSATHKSPKVKIIYIIENYVEQTSCLMSKDNTKKNKMMSGALENLVLRGIYILPTYSVKHTADTLVNLQRKLQTNKSFSDEANDNLVVSAIMTKKKDVISANIFQHQLMLIPGISSDIALKIQTEYPTVRHLLMAFDKCELDKENMLTEISLGKRKLGKVLSKRIHDVYYATNEVLHT